LKKHTHVRREIYLKHKISSSKVSSSIKVPVTSLESLIVKCVMLMKLWKRLLEKVRANLVKQIVKTT
jgi:hypothetical protein